MSSSLPPIPPGGPTPPPNEERRGKKRTSEIEDRIKHAKADTEKEAQAPTQTIRQTKIKGAAEELKVAKALRRKGKEAEFDKPDSKKRVPEGTKPATIGDLPAEITAHILSFLPNEDVGRVGRVSWNFRGHSQLEIVHRLNHGLPLSELGITTEEQLLTFLQELGEYRNTLLQLDISYIKLTAAGAQTLAGLLPATLHSFRAFACDLTDTKILSILSSCPSLLKLDLSWNRSITGATADQLPASLQEVSCAYSSFDNAGVAKLGSRCPSLLKLNLSWNGSITGATVDQLPASLQEFSCAGTSFNDAGVAKLGSRCLSLLKLNLRGNHSIIGATADQLPTTLTEYKGNITPEIESRLRFRCPGIKINNR